MIDVGAIEIVFAQMLRTAQALEELLQDAQADPPADAAALATSLQRISAWTTQQAAMVQQLQREHRIDRREAQRRSGWDRRH